MGCCALESGDAIAAIPVRKLISLRGSASPLQPRGAIVTKSKRRHPERDFTFTHPHAAAIDIGSRMHVAAVPPDRDTEPVRAFGTCTGDLRHLADWFERCGVRTVAMARSTRAKQPMAAATADTAVARRKDPRTPGRTAVIRERGSWEEVLFQASPSGSMTLIRADGRFPPV
jgi:hypothetical protein